MDTPKSTEFYEVKVPVHDQILHYLFTCAIEGGINYWATLEEYHWAVTGSDGVEDLKGFYAEIWDMEEVPPVTWRIDREVMKRGLYTAFTINDPNGSAYVQRSIRDCVLHPDNADYDADVADIVVQYGLFGEVVYG
jgi:hypothetical protein